MFSLRTDCPERVSQTAEELLSNEGNAAPAHGEEWQMKAAFLFQGRPLGAEILLTASGLMAHGNGWQLRWMQRLIARRPAWQNGAEYLLQLGEQHQGELSLRLEWGEDTD